MTVTALHAAKHLCHKGDWKYTHLQVQKILYLGQMVHLFYENEQPLVRGVFEAWKYGPVHVELFEDLKRFGKQEIPDTFSRWSNLPILAEDSSEEHWLNYLSNLFPPGSGPTLMSLTHDKLSAWRRLYMPFSNEVITHESMLREYRRRQKYHESKRTSN